MSKIRQIILKAANKEFTDFQQILEGVVEEKFRTEIAKKVDHYQTNLFLEAKDEEDEKDEKPSEEEDADGDDSEDDKEDEDKGKEKANPEER